MKTTSSSTLVAALLSAAVVNAQISTEVGTPSSTGSASGSVQTVQVGQRGLVFQPDSITAKEGDVIEFVIHTSHNVARSSFSSPCQPIGGSENIWSGDDLENGTIFSVTVNDTNPIWLYCATGQHCQDGMAMVINPASGSDTLDAYKSAAENVSNSGSPDAVAGGVYGAPSGGSGSASSSSTTASGSASASASASSGSMSMSQSTSRATTTSHSGSASSTTSASTSTSPTNAASNMVADMMMVGGAVLGGAVLLM